MTTAPALEPKAIKSFFALPIDQVVPHPENPRRVTDDHPSLPGLADAIKAIGQLQPIVVRALPEGGWQIIAGERRWRASRLAGLPTIDAKIVEADEQLAYTMTVVENLQREDLHWLEEANAVESMVKRGWDVATMVAQTGKSEAWIRLRAKLAGISAKWKKTVEDPGHELHGWPVAMLEVVARFPVTTQDLILDGDEWDLKDCKTTAELRDFLGRNYLRSLSAAPWHLADTKLVPKAGSCSACPKRTSCQQQLFEEAGKDDRCTDDACWKAKLQAHVAIAVHDAIVAEPKVLVVGHAQGLPPKIAKAAKSGQDYEPAGPKTKGALPAVFVSGDKAGTTGWVVKRKGYGGGDVTERTDREDLADTPSTRKPKVVPSKVRLAQFMKRRAGRATGLVIEKLGGKADATSVHHWGQPKACAADVTRPPRHVLAALAVAYGIKGLAAWRNNQLDAEWKDAPRLRDMTDDHLDAALWDQVRSTVISRLISDRMFRGSAVGAELMAKACGLNWKAITTAVRDGMPLPKTLALHFDQDGKPLKALVAKPTKSKPKAKKAAAK